jgi:hypothetical protein
MAGTMINTQDGKPVSEQNAFPVRVVGGMTPEPGSITTDMIADGAVTDEKLAKPKIDKPAVLEPQKVIGTTLESKELGLVNYSQDAVPDSLAMRQFTGQITTADPVADSDAATKKYVDDLTITSDKITDASAVGKSVMKAADAAAARTAIGAGTSNQNLTAMTAAEATAGTATTIRGITAQVLASGAKDAIKNKTQVAALTAIADPTNTTLEAVATLLNEVIAAFKA